MRMDYADLVLLNAEFRRKNLRYHVIYKDEYTVYIGLSGECCLTDDLKNKSLNYTKEYYLKEGISVDFSKDEFYFTCEK
ncbi:MAG: hypothetical protein ACLU62_06650 [Hydrogeniiclostridium sp.]